MKIIKKSIISIMVLSMIFTYVIPIANISKAATEDNTPIVKFKDENLKKLLTKDGVYDTNKDGELTEKEMLNVTSIHNDEGLNITNLSGLEYATNLIYINLRKSEKDNSDNILDISSLSNLNKLRYIDMTNMNVKDITPLKNLENLEEINFFQNKIEDISTLKDWKSLEKITNINLTYNNIKSLNGLPEALKKMKNLKDFDLICNGIEDISAIPELEKTENFDKVRLGISTGGEGELQFEIDLGKIGKDSIQKVKLPDCFTQVQEIYNNYNWTTSTYGKYWIEEGKIDGNTYIVDTSKYGKNEITIRRAVSYDDFYRMGKKYRLVEIKINYNIEAEGSKTKEIEIKDENLKKVLLEQGDIDGDGKFTEYDAKNLTSLNAVNKGITNLSGLENATNLRNVSLDGNNIKDISPIMNSVSLENCYLTGNQITDISCIKNRKFTKLESLILVRNYIDFPDNSENLKTLQNEIDKEKTELKDDKSIEDKMNKFLCMTISEQRHGKPEDRDKIVNMDDKIKKAIIEQLKIDKNSDGELSIGEMQDFDGIVYSQTGYTEYYNLDLSNLGLTDLSGLEYLNGLHNLDISNNNISNLEPLRYLYNLQKLNASNNNITSIDCLPYYRNTETSYNFDSEYKFSNNKIKDISCIKNWISLKVNTHPNMYWIDNEKFRDMSLYFDNNEITDISPLKDLKCIKYINLNNNKITDISSLKDYNFVINENFDKQNKEYEDLADFKGISVLGNEITNTEGNRAAIKTFKDKGVKLLTNDDLKEITLKDDATGTQITTTGEETAKIEVNKIAEDSEEYKQIVKENPDYQILYSANVSIKDGEYNGKILVTIPVNTTYNDKLVKIIHIKSDGTKEEFVKKAKDGKAEVEVNELSPFFVTYKDGMSLTGDINGDGFITASDITLIVKHIKGIKELTDEEKVAADVNGDGFITASDITLIVKHIKGIKTLN